MLGRRLDRLQQHLRGASVYPTVGSIGYDEPVIRRVPTGLRRCAECQRSREGRVRAGRSRRASWSPRSPANMFNERFAATPPVASISNAASAGWKCPKSPKPRTVYLKPVDAVKVAEAPKASVAPLRSWWMPPSRQARARGEAPLPADPAQIVPAPAEAFQHGLTAPRWRCSGSPNRGVMAENSGQARPGPVACSPMLAVDASTTASTAPKERIRCSAARRPMIGIAGLRAITREDGLPARRYQGRGDRLCPNSFSTIPVLRMRMKGVDAAANIYYRRSRAKRAVPRRVRRCWCAYVPDRRRADLRPRRPARPHLQRCFRA